LSCLALLAVASTSKRNSMGYGKGGKGGGGKGKGGGSEGANGGGDSKPFWRRFVDPSDDPEVIRWCTERIEQFLASRQPQEEVEWLTNEYRNTIRSLAPDMGIGWLKVNKGVWAFARASEEGRDPSAVRKKLIDTIVQICEEAGGHCTATYALRSLDQDLWVSTSVALKIRKLNGLVDICAKEMQDAGLRMNGRRNGFLLGEADGYEDAVFVRFDKARVSEARRALRTALQRLPAVRREGRDNVGRDFLRRACHSMGPAELEQERALPGFQRFLPSRGRLPAFKTGDEICAAVRSEQVTLILGATGCGKTTQIPQFLLEDASARGEPCRILATQPRRISAVSVAERVASERGGKLGGKVAFKIRFEDKVSEDTQLIFCTVGILLKVMQSNSHLDGATHIIVDEVHERDLHTDFLLTLLRRVLDKRRDLKVVLMSATVDPSAFQSYFPGAKTLEIPGKTNYPIEELFLEDVVQALPARQLAQWREAAMNVRPQKVSAFSQGPLPNLPADANRVSDEMPRLDIDMCKDIAWAHTRSPEELDLDLVQAIVEMVHASGEEGAILIFMPGWGEILKTMDKLQGSSISRELQVHPLHSRMPTAEQQAIFQPPPAGKRKVIIATILAETSITVEDVVFVIDPGRSRSTFFNKDSKVSALKTVWYSKANGFQRRGRSGRCRPGKWFRLYSSLQWEAMQEYELPEMLRAPLEELCLEVASLHLGPPADFLREAVSPPPQEIVQHAVSLLYNLGAVSDASGATLTPLGEKLAKIQVHPMLGKMLLLGGLFRCFQPIMTICAALGYKSPFVCPMGMEKEANQAKRLLADNSMSDLVALANAYDGWCRGKIRFATQHFISHQTMDYIHRLRGDLQGAATDVLSSVPEDHADKLYMDDVCRAVLVAGLFPNLAWIRKYGKGQSFEGLKVCVHPGSVNFSVSNSVVAFYDIQETTERFLYDTTVVSMAPCLLFAPSLVELHRGQRVVFRVNTWEVAVDPQVADDLLDLRTLLAEFISRSVGQRLTEAHMAATDALSRLFSERAGGSLLEGGDDEEEAEEGEADAPRAADGGATPQRQGATPADERRAGVGWAASSGPSGWSAGGPQEKRNWNWNPSQAWSGGAGKGKWPRR